MNVKTRSLDRSQDYKLTGSFRKCSIVLLAVIFLTTTLCFQQISLAVPTASPGDYIVAEFTTEKLSIVTPSGVRTEIYSFKVGTYDIYPDAVAVDGAGNYIVTASDEEDHRRLYRITPSGVETLVYAWGYLEGALGVAVDGAGNYIVTEPGLMVQALSKITPSGVRTVIYDYTPTIIYPQTVAVDGAGNYIVTESHAGEPNTLSKITPGGVRTVIYTFAVGQWPNYVAVDGAGNYIVTDTVEDTLSKITPGGVRTVIYTFGGGSQVTGVAVDGAGNYIVTESYAQKLSKITPGGVRTVIYSFIFYTDPQGVAVVPGATPGYSVTIWAWAENEGWMNWVPITMDGAPTGKTTPYTFTGLTGTHTFTVPSTEPMGRVFYEWSTGWTGTTLTVSSGGTYTARYRQPGKVNTQIVFALSPNPAKPGQTVTLSGTLETVGGSPVYPASVKVEYSTTGGATWNYIWTLATNAAGEFSKTFTAPGVGEYLIRVSYAGSASYNPSSATETLTVGEEVWGDYHFRINPWIDVMHIKISGKVIYGIEGAEGAYSNQPVLGYIEGSTFYIFVDWQEGTGPYELMMLVGSTSTLSGNAYRTTDGTSWVGPTSISLTSVSPSSSELSTLGQAAASAVEPEAWPPTYHFRLSPFVDVVHLGLDGAVVHGQCDAEGSYSDQPVLGYLSGNFLIFAIDGLKDGNPSIIYELSINVVSVSTMSGNMYRTVDGKSVVGPTAITLVSASS